MYITLILLNDSKGKKKRCIAPKCLEEVTEKDTNFCVPHMEAYGLRYNRNTVRDQTMVCENKLLTVLSSKLQIPEEKQIRLVKKKGLNLFGVVIAAMKQSRESGTEAEVVSIEKITLDIWKCIENDDSKNVWFTGTQIRKVGVKGWDIGGVTGMWSSNKDEIAMYLERGRRTYCFQCHGFQYDRETNSCALCKKLRIKKLAGSGEGEDILSKDHWNKYSGVLVEGTKAQVFHDGSVSNIHSKESNSSDVWKITLEGFRRMIYDVYMSQLISEMTSE